MTDLNAIVFYCPELGAFSKAVVKVVDQLPPELGARFKDCVMDSFGTFGAEVTYERMKDRTVAEIFAEHEKAEFEEPIASGHVDGVRYDLFDAHPPATPAEPPTTPWRDPVIEAYKKDVDRTLLRENLKLSVEERFRKFQSFAEYARELRAAGRRDRVTR